VTEVETTSVVINHDGNELQGRIGSE